MNNYSIQIFDDVFDKKFIRELKETCDKIPHIPNNIANRKTWPYGTVGTHNILGVDLFTKKSPYVYHSICPENVMWALDHVANNVIKKKFELLTINSNMQVMSMDGTFHRDGSVKSIIIFTTDEWNKDWGGEFEFIANDETNEKQKIDYIPGRIIYFDGDINHRGLAPNVPYVYRYSLVYRLKLLD